jgi:hypothetical protein
MYRFYNRQLQKRIMRKNQRKLGEKEVNTEANRDGKAIRKEQRQKIEKREVKTYKRKKGKMAY